jgi:hypothetical protein
VRQRGGGSYDVCFAAVCARLCQVRFLMGRDFKRRERRVGHRDGAAEDRSFRHTSLQTYSASSTTARRSGSSPGGCTTLCTSVSWRRD